LRDPSPVDLVLEQVTQIQRVALGVLPKPLCARRFDSTAENLVDQLAGLFE